MTALIPNEQNEYYLDLKGEDDPRKRQYGPATISSFWSLAIPRLEDAVVQSNTQLEKLLKTGRTTLSNLDGLNLQNGRDLLVMKQKDWNRTAHADIYRVDSMSAENITASFNTIDFLENLRITNHDILTRLRSRNLHAGDWFAITDEIEIDCPKQRMNPAPSLLGRERVCQLGRFQLVQAAKCVKCNGLIEQEKMGYHTIHPECCIERDKRQAKDNGFIKMEDFYGGMAAIEAGLANAVVATRYDIYAEPWVKDAIETWNRQKNHGDAFAELSLAEFLRKMRPS